jgi:hypothetical protein
VSAGMAIFAFGTQEEVLSLSTSSSTLTNETPRWEGGKLGPAGGVSIGYACRSPATIQLTVKNIEFMVSTIIVVMLRLQ